MQVILFIQIQYRHIFLQQKIWSPALTNCQPNVDCLKNCSSSITSSISTNEIHFWVWFPFEFPMLHKMAQVNIGNSSITIPNYIRFLLDNGQTFLSIFQQMYFISGTLCIYKVYIKWVAEGCDLSVPELNNNISTLCSDSVV